MTHKNKIVLGTTGALVVGLLAGTYLLSGLNKASFAQTASLMGIGRGRPDNVQRACADEDFRAIQTAIDNKDYNAWQELRQKYADQRQGKGVKWDEVIDSQDKFEKLVHMRQLMADGKFEEARTIRQELGFPTGPSTGRGMGKRMSQGRFQNNQ